MMLELIYGIDGIDYIGNIFWVYFVFIVFDVATGVLRATTERLLNSSVNFDGLIRKLGGLLGVVFLTFVDLYLDTNGIIVKVGVGALILYEALSITENFKRIGVNVDFVMKYFEEEKVKGEDKDEY